MNAKLAKIISVTVAVVLAVTAGSAPAQQTSASTSTGSHSSTDKSIEYHGGKVLRFQPDVYVIWYGCWGTSGCGAPAATQYNDAGTMEILTDFLSTLGSTSYFAINQLYPDANGNAPSGSLIYGGDAFDAYSHGSALTEADIAAVITDQFATGALPVDPNGIFIVVTSSDVSVEDAATIKLYVST